MVRSTSKTVSTTWSMRSILIIRSGSRGDRLDAPRQVPLDLVAREPVVPVGPHRGVEDRRAMSGGVARRDERLLAGHAGPEAAEVNGLADGVGVGRDPGARIVLHDQLGDVLLERLLRAAIVVADAERLSV